MSGELVSPVKYNNLYTNIVIAQRVDTKDNPHTIQVDLDMLMKDSEVISSLADSRPVLSKPSAAEAEQFTGQGRLTYILGKVALLGADVSDIQAKNNLSSLILKYKVMNDTYTRLSDALQEAFDCLADANEKLQNASDTLDEVVKQHQQAKDKVQELTDKLSRLSPEESEYEEVRLLLEQAKGNESELAGNVALAEETYSQCLQACNIATENVDKSLNAISEAENNYPANSISSDDSKKNILGKFITLILSLLTALNEDNVESIQTQNKIMRTLNEARINELQEKAKEIEKKQRAAERLRKGLSIFGAIIGAIMAVVGLIAAIPTGGMSVAGGVGLGFAIASAALTVVDIALTFSIDFSPVSWLMGKINEGISYVINHTLAVVIAEIAEECGASEEDVKKAKEYFTMITSAIVMVILVVLPAIVLGGGGSSTAKTATKATQATVDTAVKTATQIVKEVVNTAVKTSKILSNTVLAAKIAQLITTILNAVLSPTLSIIAGVNEKAASEALASLNMTQDDIKTIGNMRNDLLEVSQSVSCQSMEMYNVLCEVISERVRSEQLGYQNFRRFGTV